MAMSSSGSQLNISNGRHDDSEIIIAALATPAGYKGVSKKSLELIVTTDSIGRALLRHKAIQFSSTVV